MVWKKRGHGLDERLDRVGREVIRASSMNETETEAIASTPFLYSRIRSRIAEQLERREERESWGSMLMVFWRTVPAMALVAIFCLFLFWSASPAVRTGADGSEDAILSSPDAGIERVVFAENQPLSNDEVLATILNKDDGEGTR